MHLMEKSIRYFLSPYFCMGRIFICFFFFGCIDQGYLLHFEIPTMGCMETANQEQVLFTSSNLIKMDLHVLIVELFILKN